MFFSFTNNEIKEDLEFIKNKYFPTESISYTFNIVKSTRWYQQQKILSLFSYHDCDTNWGTETIRAKITFTVYQKPINRFDTILNFVNVGNRREL